MNQARGVFLRADFRMGDIFIGQPRMQARSGVFIPFKEKALEQFKREENAAEFKAVDELTSYTYGQRGKEE